MVQRFELQFETNNDILDVEGGRPQVREVNGDVREDGLCILGGNGGVDNNVIALLPVDGGGDLVFVTGLKS